MAQPSTHSVEGRGRSLSSKRRTLPTMHQQDPPALRVDRAIPSICLQNLLLEVVDLGAEFARRGGHVGEEGRPAQAATKVVAQRTTPFLRISAVVLQRNDEHVFRFAPREMPELLPARAALIVASSSFSSRDIVVESFPLEVVKNLLFLDDR